MAPAERAKIQAELQDLNTMKVEFDRRIRALEQQLGAELATGNAGATPAASVPSTVGQVRPTATTSAEPVPSDVAGTHATTVATGKSFEVYGFAQLDYVQDFKRVNPDWEATLRPSKIPTVGGLYGKDGKAILSVRQSRLGVRAAVPAGDSEIKTQFEFDLFGVGVDAGQTTFRLRQAWGSWGPILAGQTNSLFMDGDLFPNVIDYWGPTGMVFLRNPQLRVTLKDTPTFKFAVALEQANSDIDVGQIRELDPALGNDLRGVTTI
ncbi:MAG: DcaP family trimeric outer membrane transporter, partial [Polymorphobacter sp.]